MFHRVKVNIDQLVYNTSVEKPEEFAHRQTGRYRANEGRANGLPGKKRYAALIELSTLQHLKVGGSIRHVLCRRRRSPDCRRRP